MQEGFIEDEYIALNKSMLNCGLTLIHPQVLLSAGRLACLLSCFPAAGGVHSGVTKGRLAAQAVTAAAVVGARLPAAGQQELLPCTSTNTEGCRDLPHALALTLSRLPLVSCSPLPAFGGKVAG